MSLKLNLHVSFHFLNVATIKFKLHVADIIFLLDSATIGHKGSRVMLNFNCFIFVLLILVREPRF